MTHLANVVELNGNVYWYFKLQQFRVFLCRKDKTGDSMLAIYHT